MTEKVTMEKIERVRTALVQRMLGEDAANADTLMAVEAINEIFDLALSALRPAEPKLNQGMKCIACGEPMPNPALQTAAANVLSVAPAIRCKCGCERFHGTFTTFTPPDLGQ